MGKALGKFYDGAKPGRRTAVTPKSLSRQAGAFTRSFASGAFTQNSTVKTSGGPIGVACKLIAAYVSFTTLPAGGTLGLKVVAYDASANAEIDLTDAVDPETGTVREGKALVLAATNVAIAADDTIEIHTIADNSAVGTAAVGGVVTMVFFPVEDTESANSYTIGADLL